MAKSGKRGNREARKPKQPKKTPIASTSTVTGVMAPLRAAAATARNDGNKPSG